MTTATRLARHLSAVRRALAAARHAATPERVAALIATARHHARRARALEQALRP